MFATKILTSVAAASLLMFAAAPSYSVTGHSTFTVIHNKLTTGKTGGSSSAHMMYPRGGVAIGNRTDRTIYVRIDLKSGFDKGKKINPGGDYTFSSPRVQGLSVGYDSSCKSNHSNCDSPRIQLVPGKMNIVQVKSDGTVLVRN